LVLLEEEEKSFLLASIWNSAATHDGFCRSVIARLPPPTAFAAEEEEEPPFFMSPRPREDGSRISNPKSITEPSAPLES
jgi:hypothetical protein